MELCGLYNFANSFLLTFLKWNNLSLSITLLLWHCLWRNVIYFKGRDAKGSAIWIYYEFKTDFLIVFLSLAAFLDVQRWMIIVLTKRQCSSGSGKTAAFLVPVLSQIYTQGPGDAAAAAKNGQVHTHTHTRPACNIEFSHWSETLLFCDSNSIAPLDLLVCCLFILCAEVDPTLVDSPHRTVVNMGAVSSIPSPWSWLPPENWPCRYTKSPERYGLNTPWTEHEWSCSDSVIVE